MNKRQLKKFSKKGLLKTWRNSRGFHLIISAKNFTFNFDDSLTLPLGYEVSIIDSERGIFKHPLKIEVNRWDDTDSSIVYTEDIVNHPGFRCSVGLLKTLEIPMTKAFWCGNRSRKSLLK